MRRDLTAEQEIARGDRVSEPGVSSSAAVVDHASRVAVTAILPAYNEAPNLVELLPRLTAILDGLPGRYELVLVDDGSTDGTADVVTELRRRHPDIRFVRLRRNSGKSAALQAGFDHARGDLIVLLDADGQDQPEEIPALLAALDGGLDLVTGRRVDRHDRFIKRTTSKLYNAVTSRMTGLDGEDFNSGLKAMRREVVESISLYGELHRYIPVLAKWAGFHVGEIPVRHAPRLYGRSKFGRARFWRGFLDLVTVKFITTYTARPFHLFGGIGFAFGLVGVGLLAWMLALKIAGHGIGERPAFFTGILLVVVAVQLMTLGLLGELIVHLRRERPSTVEEDRPQ